MASRPIIFVFVALLAVALAPGRVHAEPQLLPPRELWSGKVADKGLQARAPESHLITSPAAFEKLWKAWRGDEELPQIDFTKDLVLVATRAGPNRVLIKPWLLDNGNLQIQIMGSALEGEGFGYSLWQLPRDGIRTIDGAALPK